MNNSKIWITGAKGEVGSELVKLLEQADCSLLATDTDVDVTNLQQISQYTDINRPDVIINCAAMTDIIACEENVVDAYRLNALGARNLSAASRKIGAKIIHISTDDVFEGSEQKSLTEFDPTAPSTIYGKSKLAGETLVRDLNPKHLIVRSSWIYGDSEHNFVYRLLEAAKENTALYIPTDQISSPTSAYELAKFIQFMIGTNEYGTYHASCEGQCSRYDFANEIIKLSPMSAKVEPIVSNRSGSPIERPRNTLLENMMMKMTNIYHMPLWKDALHIYMEEKYGLKRRK